LLTHVSVIKVEAFTISVRFQVLMLASMKMTVVWDVVMCSLVLAQHLGRQSCSYCMILILEGNRFFKCPHHCCMSPEIDIIN
jgi:hypothetical protein